MKEFPIHQNLSTSFVDLPALVRHLRGFQFVGMVHLELSNYEARIFIDPDGKVTAEEMDHRSGMLSRGSEAYKRVLMRSRETHGRIQVMRTEYELDELPSLPVYVENSIARSARAMAGGISDSPVAHLIKRNLVPADRISTAEAARLESLMVELLESIDDVLTKANLNFAAAFRNAAFGVRSQHPFIDPDRQSVVFKNGKISVNVTVTPEQFTEGLVATLNVILARLCGKKSFAKLVAYLQHRVMMHKSKHEKDYYELGVSHIIDRLIRG